MISKQFVTAGNAIFTVKLSEEAAKSQNRTHYTFKVRSKDTDELGFQGKKNVVYFVSVLTGPDNNSNYSYIGLLNVQTGELVQTRKSLWNRENYGFKLLNRVLARLWENNPDAITAAGFDVYHEGRCGRCGRKLTVPESIESGIGPDCAGMIAA